LLILPRPMDTSRKLWISQITDFDHWGMSPSGRRARRRAPRPAQRFDQPVTPAHAMAPEEVRVAAIARGADKVELAQKLGAHHYIDNAATNPAEALQALGGAKVVLITASGGKTVAETFKGLRPGGVSIVLGVGPEPIEVSSMDLIIGCRKLEGALTGDPATRGYAPFQRVERRVRHD
jgi:hypothetical protein